MRFALILTLILLAGCASGDPARQAQMTDNEIAQLWLNGRQFPSLALQPDTPRSTQKYIPPVIGADLIEPIPALQGNKAPYCFCTNDAPWQNFFWGRLWYSNGYGEPELLYPGNATSAYLCEGFVKCIIITDYYIDGMYVVIESRPAQIDVETGEVEFLAEVSNSPPWNYIVTQEGGSYAYARINIVGLQGEMVFNHDGEVWTQNGSFLQPDMDDDMMTWGEYHGAYPAGEVHIYLYDMNTGNKEVYYAVGDSVPNGPNDFVFYEAEYSHIVDGNIAFTVVFYNSAAGGALDNTPYLNGYPLPHSMFRWVGGISLDEHGNTAYQGNNYGYPTGALFSCIEGELYMLDIWMAPWIENWLCIGNGRVIYSKLPDKSVNRMRLGGYGGEQLSNYTRSVCMVSAGKKTSAM
jgi:hypothetical protein